MYCGMPYGDDEALPAAATTATDVAVSTFGVAEWGGGGGGGGCIIMEEVLNDGGW